MNALPASTDVFAIGGGPAGLAAAIAARRRGFDVTLADSSVPPIDKACGEGVMPDGLRRRAIRAMSAAPRLFQGMLAMHVGEFSLPAFLTNGFCLAWRMLTI